MLRNENFKTNVENLYKVDGLFKDFLKYATYQRKGVKNWTKYLYVSVNDTIISRVDISNITIENIKIDGCLIISKNDIEFTISPLCEIKIVDLIFE